LLRGCGTDHHRHSGDASSPSSGLLGWSSLKSVTDAADVGNLVRGELGRIGDEGVREAIANLLVEPRREMRSWDYGPDGTMYACWIVLEHRASNTVIVHCEEGFGAKDPWGMLFLEGPHQSMGMDSQWYATLEDAFRESGACDFPAPPGYEIR